MVTVTDDGIPHGMTASSFAALSLQPPLILVCLDKTSRTRGLILKTRSFAVNILAADQEELARGFAAAGTKPFTDLTHRPAPGGSPVLDGAVAWLECDVADVFEGGDHDIVVGAVNAADVSEREPLIYFDRSYRSLL